MECPGSPPRVLFECDFCEGVFHTVRALRAHRYKVHGIESNAEVMVDIEHVACQMDAVNAYTEPDLTSEITIDWDECHVPRKFKHRVKQHKRPQHTLAIGKQKNKVTKKRQRPVVKKRRISLNKMPACFQAAQVEGKQAPDEKEPFEIDILKSIYGDVDACDSDLSGTNSFKKVPCDDSGKHFTRPEQNGESHHSDGSQSVSSRSPSEPYDLSLPSKSHSPSSRSIQQASGCPDIPSVQTFQGSCPSTQEGLQHRGPIEDPVPPRTPDNKSKGNKSENGCSSDLSDSKASQHNSNKVTMFPECSHKKLPEIKLEPAQDEISNESSHRGKVRPNESLKEPHLITKHPSYQEVRFPYGRRSSTSSACQQPSIMNKVKDRVKSRTRTKARLKKNLHRTPGKIMSRRNCSLQPFTFRPTSTSDSPPHLSPITSLPTPSSDKPRVPKVRLKRQNSTEFKAYFIPCNGIQNNEVDDTDEDVGDSNEDIDDDDEEDDPIMPNLERQEDLMPILSDDVSNISSPSRPPPTLLEAGELCQKSNVNISEITSDMKPPVEHLQQTPTLKPSSDIKAISKVPMPNEIAGSTTDSQIKTDIKEEHLGDKQTEDDRSKMFICRFCGKIYKWLIHFRVHESKHAAGKMFHCRNCDFSAVDKTDVIQHCESLEHRMAGKTLIKWGQCTWLGDGDTSKVPVEPPPLIIKKPTVQRSQKKGKQKKQGCRKVRENSLDAAATERKVGHTKSNRVMLSLDKLIDSFAARSGQNGPEKKYSRSKCSVTRLSNTSGSHLVTHGRAHLQHSKFPTKTFDFIKKESQSDDVEQMTSGDMKTEDSFLEPVKQSSGCVKNNLAKALPPSGIVASLKNTEQSQKSELLGKRKKKNYNKLFNHRTRKRCKRAKMVVKMEDVDPEEAEQSDQMVSVTLLNCCEEVDKAVDGSERVLPQGSACLTDTANKTKNYCILTETIDRNLESTAKMSAGKAKPKKTRGKGATLKKCSGQKRIGSQTAKRGPKKGRGRQIPTDFQGHSTSSRKVKVKRKPSKKDPAKGKKVKFGKRKNGDKKGTAVTQPKTSRGRWKRKRHRKDFASKGVQEFCENLSCNQASGSHEFEKDISLEINTATDIQQEMNVQCEQTVTELKQNDLASFVKRPSTGVTTDCCLTVGCLQHQKSFDASNRCESPERRRPGLVHRRHLILDNDADDDVGYHSSGSLDQVLHDESYDTAGGRTSQSVQRKELEGFQRETPESQRMVCRHIRRLVTNLCTSQQVNSNKLFKPELDNIKKEITNKDSEKMTVNLLKTRSFLDSLIPPPEGSQKGSISDGEMLKCEANMKQEPTSGSETGRMSARNAINDFAAKLNKFKFRVRPETLKGQKSSLAVDDTTYNVKQEQPEPEKLNDQCELAGSSGLVINRCDSGVYVESPTDGLMKLTSVTGGVERKLIKSEMPMESKRRSLWDCILPDLLSNADKSHTDGTMDGETRLLTRIKTEGSGQEKKHYIYCPACCSQVLIKAEPPAGSSLSCSGVIPHNEALSNQGESSSDVTSMDCFSSKVSSCMTSNEEDGNHTPLHVSEGWSLKQDPQIASCSQESQLSSSDLMVCTHGVCEPESTKQRLLSDSLHALQNTDSSCGIGYSRGRGFIQSFHYIGSGVPTAHQMMRLVKHKHHIPAASCDTVIPVECIKYGQRIIQVPYSWQHINSTGPHNHTDDCIYGGCQLY